MKCKKCKFAKFNNDKITFQCTNIIIEMDIQCLLRQIVGLMTGNRELAKKTEKIIDKTLKDLDEGEEWKK